MTALQTEYIVTKFNFQWTQLATMQMHFVYCEYDDDDDDDKDDDEDFDDDDDGENVMRRIATSCKESNFNELCLDDNPRQEKAE